MHLSGTLMAVALLLAADPDRTPPPAAPNGLALPAATQSALPPAVQLAQPPAVTPSPETPQLLQTAGVVSGTTPLATAPAPVAAIPAGESTVPRLVWGVMDGKIFPASRRMAPNGQPYHPLFTLDLDINIWLWPSQGLYVFGDTRFWGQRGTAGQTHGSFDYTKREYDLTAGVAWNYYGMLEFRGFGFAYNNLNRGNSLTHPFGFNDGVAVENRWYLSTEYTRLGQDGYNISRATFVSLGYFPSKDIIGLDGELFNPGLFARAYVIWDLPGFGMSDAVAPGWGYLFGDVQLICAKSTQPRLLVSDIGLALTPCATLPMFELRFGSEFVADLKPGQVRSNSLPYFSVRLNY